MISFPFSQRINKSNDVQDYHTYYVGSEGILVHNDCPIKPGTKEWNKAVKDIKNSANIKGKLNFTVENQATAEALMSEAGLPLQSFDDVIYVHDTLSLPNGNLNPSYRYNIGFEIHPIDNGVGMPHFKFWSRRANGHVYWPGG